MEGRGSPSSAGRGSPISGSDSLLSSVLAELKQNTKRIPPVVTKLDKKSTPKKEAKTSSHNSPKITERNGIAEYSAYARVIDPSSGNAREKNAGIWKKIKSPPIKPKRKKKSEKPKISAGLDTEIHSMIESAFQDNAEPMNDDPDDLEPAVFSPESTPLRTYSDPTEIDIESNRRSYQRHLHGSSIHSDIISDFSEDRRFKVQMHKLETSRSFDSLDDPRFETVSMFSQISNEDPNNDWMGGTATDYGDTMSLSSFASVDGQLNGKPEKKHYAAKARAKQIKKQAAALKERGGAFLDVAASNATNKIKKMRKPSIRFSTGRAKLQRLANRIGAKQNDSSYSINNISSPNIHRMNGSFSDNEDGSKKGSFHDKSLPPPYGYSDNASFVPQGTVKSGYLKKQGTKLKSWNERWFILKGDRLHYYKEENGKHIASIFLPGSKVEPFPPRAQDAHKFAFELIPDSKHVQLNNNHESYLLSASSQSDMDEWVKAIRRVILSPFGGGIFGQNLDETLRHDRRIGSTGSMASVKSGLSGRPMPRQVPIIVENCVEFMRANKGLTEEGLFRLPGQANEVKDLQDAFDMGERPVFPKSTDVHTIASLLKCYLRELPEPIIPFEQYETFLNAAKPAQIEDADKRSETGCDLNAELEETKRKIKEQVNRLPQSNFDLLRYLCQFLDEVQRNSASNKMDVSNLALVFGPNLMRAKEENALTMMADQTHVQRVIHYFIENHEYFFPDDEPLHRSKLSYDSNSLERVAEEGNLNGDAGIGTLTTTASPTGTLGLRRGGDDSGTGSLDNTPENTQKRAPPIPLAPPPSRKPFKPNRRRTSAQSAASLDALPSSEETQRKSYYDNVSASSSGQHDPDTHSNASINAIAGSVDSLDSRRSNSVHSDYSRSGQPTPEKHSSHLYKNPSNGDSHPESDPSFLSRKHSGSGPLPAVKDSVYHLRTSSCPSAKLSSSLGIDSGKRIQRLSIGSGTDEPPAMSHPVIPPKPQLRPKKSRDNQSVSSQRSSKTDPSSISPSSSDRRSTSSPGKSAPSYKELEQQVQYFKDELQKKEAENEKRVKLLEDHFTLRMRSIHPSNSSFSSATGTNEERTESPLLSEDSAAEIWDPHSALGRRLSTESQADSKYQEEVKRHAITKIRLRNAERGLQQAEERNKQLQKEMEQFFETFGGMLPPST